MDVIGAVVAEDVWILPGTEIRVHVRVGQPRPAEPTNLGSDWYCPISVLAGDDDFAQKYTRGEASRVHLVYGVGPADALANACTILSRIVQEYGGVVRVT